MGDVLRIAWQDKHLMWLPVLSFFAAAIAVISIAVGGAGFAWFFGMGSDGTENLFVLISFLAYFVLAFIQTYFYAVMVAAVHERLAGASPRLGLAFREANKRLGRILAGSIVLATVNLLLRWLGRGRGTRVLAAIAATGWNLATYFVVPVLMFEDRGLGASMKRSTGIFKKTWGESMVGHVGIGFIVSLLFVPVIWVAQYLGTAVASAGGFGLGLLVAVLVVASFLAFASLVQAVYKTELYRYAAQGHRDPPFQAIDLAQTPAQAGSVAAR